MHEEDGGKELEWEGKREEEAEAGTMLTLPSIFGWAETTKERKLNLLPPLVPVCRYMLGEIFCVVLARARWVSSCFKGNNRTWVVSPSPLTWSSVQ